MSASETVELAEWNRRIDHVWVVRPRFHEFHIVVYEILNGSFGHDDDDGGQERKVDELV